MVLSRRTSAYIISYYIPSALFVVVSWISFLIPANKIAGRMILLVTIFLVLVNIFNTVTTNSPKVQGLTAIGVWMLVCILFVFGALVEFAVVLFKHMRAANSQYSTNSKQEIEEYAKMEKLFVIILPILFLIFNIIYWPYYLI